MNSWGLVNEKGTAQTDNTAYTLRAIAPLLKRIQFCFFIEGK